MLQNGHFTKTITHIAIRLPQHGDPTVAVRSRDPTQILPHSLPALQSLIVFYAQMDHLDPSAGSNCAFPNVHTLVLFTAGQLISHHLAKTFPNVKDLVLIREAGAKPRDQSYYEVSGSLNRQMQATHGSWSSLRQVGGTLEDLYMLGLPSKVQQVDMIWGRHAESRKFFGAVLSSSRPEVLVLDIQARLTALDRNPFEIFSASKTVVANLKVLDLRLRLAGEEKEEDALRKMAVTARGDACISTNSHYRSHRT